MLRPRRPGSKPGPGARGRVRSSGRWSDGPPADDGAASGAKPEPKDADAARLAALRLLARRDYAIGELRDWLAQDGFPPEAVEPVVVDLVESRALDDERFAASYVAYHAGRGQGPWRISQELSGRGVAQAVIDAALAGEDWPALARQARSRRFGPEPPEEWPEKARQSRFLQYRGFSSDHIRLALAYEFDPEDPS